MTEGPPSTSDDYDPVRAELAAQAADEAAAAYSERYPTPDEVAPEGTNPDEPASEIEGNATKQSTTEEELRAAQHEAENMPDQPPVWGSSSDDEPLISQGKPDQLPEDSD